MANVYATKSGLWSDTTVWNTAALPTIIDDVYSNNFTVTINVDANVRSITTRSATGINAGGGFRINDNVSLSAYVAAGTTNTLTFLSGSPNKCTIFGNVSGSTTTGGINGINNASNGTINIYGNCIAPNPSVGPGGFLAAVAGGTGTINVYGNVYGGGHGASNQFGIGIDSNAAGVVNVVGDCIGGLGLGNFNPGIYARASNATISVTGNVIGGSTGNSNGINSNAANTITVIGYASGGTSAPGITNSTTGTVFVYGSAYGHFSANVPGVNNSSSGRMYIFGNAVAGNTGAGASNSSTGLLYITRAVGNAYGAGSVGIASQVGASNSQNGLMYVEEVEFGPRGQTPISGPVFIVPKANNVVVGRQFSYGPTTTFFGSLSVSNLFPPTSSVRSGVKYNLNNFTGTMVVPPASAVQFGVPVDNTFGTALLRPEDVWNYPLSGSLNTNSFGDKLKNTATIQSLGQQIAAFNS